MRFPEYKRDLERRTAEFVLEKYYHTGESYAFLGRSPGTEAKLKTEVAKKLTSKFRLPVHTLQLIVSGSAHLGFCPIPVAGKWGRPFDPKRSDIDIAIVSPELFRKCWTELQENPPQYREQIADDLFWGFINPHTVRSAYQDPPHNLFADRLWTLFGSIHTDAAKGVRGRLYRSLWEMQNYHRRAIVWAKELIKSNALP